MNWRIATALVVAFSLVPLLPAVQASHFQAYGNYPDGHDDIGSSNEPDFRGTTSILGVPVNERVIDTNLDGIAEPTGNFPNNGKVLAPGCTDDTGRQPNGMCGLWTIGAMNGEGTESGLGFPPRFLGVESGPGPSIVGKAKVRILDQKAVADYAAPGTGTNFVDFNKKVQDSGLRTALQGIDPNVGGDFLAYSMAHFAWYGSWEDKNGNGVIDHLQAGINPQNGNPVMNPGNEFQWYGNCKAFDGTTNIGWHCADESATAPGGSVELAAYIYPGNHHAYCGALIAGQASNLCDKVGVDFPGANLLCLADVITAPVAPVATALLGRCFTFRMEDIDDNEAVFEGDPIFGNQGSVAPDQTFDDRSGDQGFDTRGWYFGLGWPTFYYDQSLVTSTTVISVANCNEGVSARFYEVNTCRFVDVDQYKTWNPVLESMVGGLKPAARSNYLLVRDTYGPFGNSVDGAVNNAALDTSSTTGPVNDQVQNPGWSREPNAAGDIYPGAVRGACANGDATHNGWCNNYAGYRAASRGWADAQLFRSVTYDRAVQVTGLPGCQLCVSGPGITTSDNPETQRQAGDHSRSLGPGGYFFAGASGRWLDKSQTWTESFVDLAIGSPTFGQAVTRTHVRAPDGWIGNIVNATATFYYRGYADETCTTEKGLGTYTYAECNPYMDGAVGDPQQAGATGHTEWAIKGCDATSAPGREIQLIPEGGTWTVPILVMRNHAFIKVPDYVTQNNVQDFTGTSGPINIGINCFESGGFLSNDFILLPLGNSGLKVTTKLTQRIAQAPPSIGFDAVVDVDVYAPLGA
jgi:hypothetical protein